MPHQRDCHEEIKDREWVREKEKQSNAIPKLHKQKQKLYCSLLAHSTQMCNKKLLNKIRKKPPTLLQIKHKYTYTTKSILGTEGYIYYIYIFLLLLFFVLTSNDSSTKQKKKQKMYTFFENHRSAKVSVALWVPWWTVAKIRKLWILQKKEHTELRIIKNRICGRKKKMYEKNKVLKKHSSRFFEQRKFLNKSFFLLASSEVLSCVLFCCCLWKSVVENFERISRFFFVIGKTNLARNSKL